MTSVDSNSTIDVLNFEHLENKFVDTVKTPEWQQVQQLFNSRDIVLMFGHGGNMAVTVHLAADITRVTNKTAISPGSGVLVTSYLSANNYRRWLTEWVSATLRHLDPAKVLVIGCSCSQNTESYHTILGALQHSAKLNVPSVLFCAKPHKAPHKIQPVIEVNTNCAYYHTAETLYQMMFYQLIHGFNQGTPLIPVLAPQEDDEKELDTPSSVPQCTNCDNGDLDHSFCASDSSNHMSSHGEPVQ